MPHAYDRVHGTNGSEERACSVAGLPLGGVAGCSGEPLSAVRLLRAGVDVHDDLTEQASRYPNAGLNVLDDQVMSGQVETS